MNLKSKNWKSDWHFGRFQTIQVNKTIPIAITVKWLRKNRKITAILKIVKLDAWIIKYLTKYYKLSILTVALAHKDMNFKNKMNGSVIQIDNLWVILAS